MGDDELDRASAEQLSQVTAPMAEFDRKRLIAFWARVIAESGVDLPRAELPAGGARRGRRITRQRADRLVRVLSPAHRTAAGISAGSGVAA